MFLPAAIIAAALIYDNNQISWLPQRVMIFGYFILVFLLGLLGAYTIRFQSATLHWGRILAGEESLEAKTEGLDPEKKAFIIDLY